MSKPKFKTIAFDADDTLWVNETFFSDIESKFVAMIRPYAKGDTDTIKKRLFETEMRNLSLFGYGAKGFTLSLVETAIELSEGQIPATGIQQLLDYGKDLIQHPIHLLEGAEETIKSLSEHYKLMVITKGDLFHQEDKLARSGLADLFDYLEIVSEKDEATYKRVYARYDLDPAETLMVGNSLKSDVIPILDIGGHAVHIPFHTTWAHEKVSDSKQAKYQYATLKSLNELEQWLEEHGA
ncbi:haloacid dehalogenase [Fulvitalea axinellae]|uniref:Haloacid dehalogenase n=1 Tax=Fulvitalea axinellae TaxID=1182444 RepID=A0AAU9D004_9BACT|nr:haloacid dehalogenase [Fulvitalea axinellae]